MSVLNHHHWQFLIYRIYFSEVVLLGIKALACTHTTCATPQAVLQSLLWQAQHISTRRGYGIWHVKMPTAISHWSKHAQKPIFLTLPSITRAVHNDEKDALIVQSRISQAFSLSCLYWTGYITGVRESISILYVYEMFFFKYFLCPTLALWATDWRQPPTLFSLLCLLFTNCNNCSGIDFVEKVVAIATSSPRHRAARVADRRLSVRAKKYE